MGTSAFGKLIRVHDAIWKMKDLPLSVRVAACQAVWNLICKEGWKDADSGDLARRA